MTSHFPYWKIHAKVGNEGANVHAARKAQEYAMPTQENAPARQDATGDVAEGALRDIGAAKAGARLRARLLPAWYGPAVAASLIVPALGRAWSEGQGGWAVPLALALSLAGLAVVVALVNAARRGAGVRVTEPWSARLRRAAPPLLLLVGAGLATWGLCSLSGAGRTASEIALFTVLGLVAWAEFAARNRSVRKRLQDSQGSADARRR